MSIEAMTVALHHSRHKGTTKLVLIGIANHVGDGGAWPSIETLARYAGVSERQVQRAIRTLAASGEIRVDLQAGGTIDLDDYRRPNRYEVVLACPPWCDRTTQHRDTRRLAGRQLQLTGVTPVSPHRGTGVTPMSPPPVTPMSPKPSLSTGANSGSASTTGRARACSVCGLDRPRCEARASINGHTYQEGSEWTTKL